MSKNLYIDASHPNETRVVLKSDDNIEDYEYESVNNSLIKNNIYLGKVSRIEPSLQAAFIDFGRERHGFLSFNDIQSDYYQIPQSDLERIKQEEEQRQKEELERIQAEEATQREIVRQQQLAAEVKKQQQQTAAEEALQEALRLAEEQRRADLAASLQFDLNMLGIPSSSGPNITLPVTPGRTVIPAYLGGSSGRGGADTGYNIRWF